MNTRCVTHNQHHCIHAHECNNPIHKQKLAQSSSKDNLNKKTLPIRKQKQIEKCKSGNLVPSSVSISKPRVGIQNIKQNNRQLVQITKSISPDCKNLQFERMFLNLNQKYKQLLEQFQELKRQKQSFQDQLKSEKLKNVHLQNQLNKKNSLEVNYNQLLAQYQRIKDIKKQLSVSQNKGLGLQSQIAKLKHIIQNLNNQKDRIREQSNRNAKKAGQIQSDFEKQNRQKESLKRKLQQCQNLISQLQSQNKNMISKNKLNQNELVDDYQKKLRALDQKFSFSCDQLNEAKKTQAKLRNKIKQFQEQIHEERLKQSNKPKTSEPSKVEKELMALKQKSTKQNQKLRQTIIEYEHDKRRIQEQLSRTTTKLTDQIRQLQKLLKIKQSQIQSLQDIKITSEKQVGLLRDNKLARDKEKEKREQELKKIGISIDDKTKTKGSGQNNKQDQDPTSIRGTYSQVIAIRHLQNRNAQLERQVQQLLIKGTVPGQTISFNDYNQFEKVIKQNNKRIKDLIIQKGKQIQTNSKLKIENTELKNHLASRNSSLTTNPQDHSQQYKIRQLANIKNSLSSAQFQLKQVRNQNYEINNKYSDYYILKDDNQALKMKLREMVDLIQTLKKAMLHNSYQKQALIVDNQQLIDQLTLVTSLPPRF